MRECFVSVCRSVCSVRVMNYVYVITVCVLCVSEREREREGGRYRIYTGGKNSTAHPQTKHELAVYTVEADFISELFTSLALLLCGHFALHCCSAVNC